MNAKLLAQLFLTFAKVGVMTFGGGMAMLPILQREVVEDKGWAFVDAVESRFRFADGSSLPFTEAGAVYLLPPAYLLPARPTEKP